MTIDDICTCMLKSVPSAHALGGQLSIYTCCVHFMLIIRAI